MLRQLARSSAAGRQHALRAIQKPHEAHILWHRRAALQPLSLRLLHATAPMLRTDAIELVYQKKSPLEHVLLRPGMYIGSVESTKETMWVWNNQEKRMTQRANLEYTPALYKIFDEILVNAVDNKVRDDTMSRLDVTIHPGSSSSSDPPRISIFNDGKGIPVQFHKDEQVYVPELVLGHLLTGSNFDDATARLTGGRHGYGAKLTNIFSTEFTVDTGDAHTGLQYTQTWRHNMRERGDPVVVPYTGPNYTRITFVPDLKRFHVDSLTLDMQQVLQKRVVDVAGCLTNVSVSLNGEVVPLSGFQEYVQSYCPSIADNDDDDESAVLYTKVNRRWEVAVMPSDGGYSQVSFVNGMTTIRGGTHVQIVLDQLCRRVADTVAARHRDLPPLQSSQIKPHLRLFVKALVENPTFDSQMKECLTSKPEFFGSSCILTERYIKQVLACGIVERVVGALKTKQRTALLKKVAKKSNTVQVPKLEDANWAGTSKAHKCTLILTEGDSAKALAVAGLSVVGRDAYGVFPLRGKFLNVRDATDTQLTKNAEFSHLCTILGLKLGLKYDTSAERATLRWEYGQVMLMTDQDHDGSHIKGLLLNLFHSFWPALLEANYVSAFLTPLLKVHPSVASKKPALPFFSMPEYDQWKADHPSVKHSVKYYKGLGTSTSKEGQEYFDALNDHRVEYTSTSPADGDALAMVFSKDRVADRKQWLRQSNPLDFVFERVASMSLGQFVHAELIQYSHADNIRSIPNVIDGLKPSQRKVLFACFRRHLVKEMKVAQLAGYCAEHTAYHHGEASLLSTIVNMAQDFVGSNNVPLLVPSGQFGTRLQGGKDAASARYIFTHLQPYTRLIFPAADEALLEYVHDDGVPVEPVYFVPILPMLLVNGADGIGTGWSTSVPSHHPIQVIDWLLARLMQPSDEWRGGNELEPWVKGFQGRVTSKPNGFGTEGVVQVVHDKKKSWTLAISELPVGKWIDDYKTFLWSLVAAKKVQTFTEHHTDRTVHFEVVVPKDDSDDDLAAGIDWTKWFKLESNLNTTNMHAFDSTNTLQKYQSSADILDAFYPVRLALYHRRKEYLVDESTRDLRRLTNRARRVLVSLNVKYTTAFE
ncbi:hypothetical protein DYB37_005617 [Aphanomyces astaci]|uniref:DNA topoisomerase 2 n=1 Tax=Aphanomyces astaci TaxID=112090 RepID=A0A3R7APR4_APHAT|nr:hypothetical protein DYB37_005617 [Aphanomyces astaci]